MYRNQIKDTKYGIMKQYYIEKRLQTETIHFTYIKSEKRKLILTSASHDEWF